jgi:hypothetical protein
MKKGPVAILIPAGEFGFPIPIEYTSTPLLFAAWTASAAEDELALSMPSVMNLTLSSLPD